jgi:hypothetical protein
MPTLSDIASIRETPRNQTMGYISDFLNYLDQNALQKQFGYRNPVTGVISEALGIPAAARVANKLSYGEPITNVGKANVPLIPEDTAEAAMFATPIAGAYGKYGGKELLRLINNAHVYGEGKLANITPQPMRIFVGPNSATFDKVNAVKAHEMEKAGVDPEKIWQETGTFRGPDKQWRQEISDKSAKITDEVFNQISTDKKFKGPMSQGLAHEELYKAYPQAGQIPTLMFADATPSGNMVKGRVGTFQSPQITAGGPSTMEQRSVALHELQHAVQQREGFASGGSPNMFKPNDVFTTQALEDSAIIDKLMRGANLNQLEAQQRFETLFKRKPSEGAFAALERVGTGKKLDEARDAARLAEKPYESYRRLAGEAEARAVQKRRNFTEEERRKIFPLHSYDVPIKDLIFR